MAMDMVGKVLAVITMLWGVFFLIVYWTLHRTEIWGEESSRFGLLFSTA